MASAAPEREGFWSWAVWLVDERTKFPRISTQSILQLLSPIRCMCTVFSCSAISILVHSDTGFHTRISYEISFETKKEKQILQPYVMFLMSVLDRPTKCGHKSPLCFLNTKLIIRAHSWWENQYRNAQLLEWLDRKIWPTVSHFGGNFVLSSPSDTTCNRNIPLRLRYSEKIISVWTALDDKP